jgi:catechol-2,3-dioxygenase
MQIQQVIFNSPHIAAQQHFFEQTLGFSVERIADDRLTIQAGTSKLTFVQNADHHPYHYAFDIPQNQFAQARDWVGERVEILSDCEGVSEFHFTDWNAHAIYFKDGDGNIAEFIARHNLDTARMMSFTSQSIVRISEVGIVTPHVIETVSALRKQAGIKGWRGAGSETFTAVGTEEGLLIVVREGRVWRPTSDVFSAIAPLELVLADVESLDVPGLPYRIHAADTETA